MKSLFQSIAAVSCALALAACGGGSGTTDTSTTAVVQPAYKSIDTVTGSGAVAASGDLLVVHYSGYLYDASKTDFKGAKFDSSVDRGVPFSFTLGVGAVIPGWDAGLVGMKSGGKRTLILPASMAYGSATRSAQAAVGSNTYAAIAANSPLVFDVELISVSKATTPVSVPPPSTLVTKDLVLGSGTAAASGKAVTIHYSGWLYDGTRVDFKGTLFDSNSSTTAPFGFTIGAGAVVAGMEQGVVGMLVGGKREITIPPSLGYGASGYGSIPGNATLIFDVELLSVK